ncbi:hypothetical protein BDR07DRAFT_193191 [Suillus spraguei]|nr:hypothetical protein BDR07DRAFT_193191 [Suillus spraguei]
MVRQDDTYITLFVIEYFGQLFGWDLESLLLTTHQRQCQDFLAVGKPDEALEAHKYMMDVIDEPATRVVQRQVFSDISRSYHTYPHFTQNIQGTMRRVDLA